MEASEVMGGLQASVKLQSPIQKRKLLKIMGGLQSSVINLAMEAFWSHGWAASFSQAAVINPEIEASAVMGGLQASEVMGGLQSSVIIDQSRHGNLRRSGWLQDSLINPDLQASKAMGELELLLLRPVLCE